MRDYQSYLFEEFKEFMGDPVYPPYPPYHVGNYLEQLDTNDLINFNTDRYYLPIFWTNVYKKGHQRLLQNKLSDLDKKLKYFAICTHDDAPMEELPPDTKIFKVGINGKKGITIPPIASKIPTPSIKEKSIFCSFVGSITHHNRYTMCKTIASSPNKDYYKLVAFPNWEEKVSEDRWKLFDTISSQSLFILSPRGYSPTSMRLYESMQYKAIPVYISDVFLFPWKDELNWDKLCIPININNIEHIHDILTSLTLDDIAEKLQYIESVYDNFFTRKGILDNIRKRL